MKINLSKLWNTPRDELPEWVNYSNIIYKCTNLVNDKCYIGQTSQSLYNRWCSNSIMSHKNDIYCDRVLFRAIRKYNPEKFEISILEVNLINSDYRKSREIYWIKYYHSYTHDPEGPGYNMTRGGDDNIHMRDALIKKYPHTNGMPTEARIRLLELYPDTNGTPPQWNIAGLDACKRKYGLNGANPKLLEASHSSNVVRRAQASREKNYYKGLPPEINTKEAIAKRGHSIALSLLFKSITSKLNKIKELGLPVELDSYKQVVGSNHYSDRIGKVIQYLEHLKCDSRWTPEIDKLFSSLIDSDQVNTDSTSTTIEKQ